MKNFAYNRAKNAPMAIELSSQHFNAKYLGGGTNLVDLMRENIEQPNALVDVTHLPDQIEETPEGAIHIGAAVKNTELANHRLIRERYPFLSQAILMGASGQIRNMATVAGNILQRTRCHYFYDQASLCNKRQTHAGCDALDGFNRMHAILGASKACIATHPSDMCVALSALDATVLVEGKNGPREIAFTDFHHLPGDTPQVENQLQPNDLITAIQIPPLHFAKNSSYRKVRDRASYAFALVSVAAALEVEHGAVKHVRIALGGVAHKPWRAFEAELALKGAPIGADSFRQAAEQELKNAQGFAHNHFKIELAKRMMVNVLTELAEHGGAL